LLRQTSYLTLKSMYLSYMIHFGTKNYNADCVEMVGFLFI